MSAKKFALIGGIVMLAMGLVSLVPMLVGSAYGLPALRLETSYGLFLGIFPMNILNKLALIAFGAAGIWVYRTPNVSAVLYSRSVFAVMGVAAILGFIPATNTLFGYWPLFGAEIAVHAFFAVLGAYFGFAATSWSWKTGWPRETSSPGAR